MYPPPPPPHPPEARYLDFEAFFLLVGRALAHQQLLTGFIEHELKGRVGHIHDQLHPGKSEMGRK